MPGSERSATMPLATDFPPQDHVTWQALVAGVVNKSRSQDATLDPATAEASLRSARTCRPDARIVLLTDEHTVPPARLGFDAVIRAPLPRGELMANRFRAAQQ